MPETVLSSRLCAVLTPAPDVVRRWQSGSSVQQDLDDLVVVGVGCQDEGRDVGSEGGRV